MVYIGDNAPYHQKGLREIADCLEDKGKLRGARFVRNAMVNTLPGNSIANAIENALHSPAKQRFYKCGATQEDFKIKQIVEFYRTNYALNMSVSRNYLRALTKMILGK